MNLVSLKGESQNQVFLERASGLGRLAMGLMFEFIANNDSEVLPSKDMFLQMTDLEQITKSLLSDWLIKDDLRKDVELYLKSLQVDIYNISKQPSTKSIEQHSFAQVYLFKGFE